MRIKIYPVYIQQMSDCILSLQKEANASGQMREKMKLGKMPFLCRPLCMPSSTAQSRLVVTSGI